jgi:hypothetical protein
MQDDQTPSTPAPLPTLDHADKDLLLLYLSLDESPGAAAQQSGIHYLDLLAWTSRPDIAAYIEHHREIRAQRQRDAALAHLEHIMRNTQDDTICCRAAIAILRATDPARFKIPRRSRPSRTAAAAGAAPPPDPCDPRPTPPSSPPGTPPLPPPSSPTQGAAANSPGTLDTRETTVSAATASPTSASLSAAQQLASELLATIAREDELADQCEDLQLDALDDPDEGEALDEDLSDLDDEHLDTSELPTADLTHAATQLPRGQPANRACVAPQSQSAPVAPSPSLPTQDPAAPEHIPRY